MRRGGGTYQCFGLNGAEEALDALVTVGEFLEAQFTGDFGVEEVPERY